MAPRCARLALLLLPLLAARHAAAISCVGVPQTTPKNAKDWPSSCSGLSGGSICLTSCSSGYGSPQTPSSVCNASTGVWGSPVGSCNAVCTTVPPNEVLPGGQWPASCANTTAVRARCLGVCNSGLVGSPSIECTAGRWATELLVGQCVPPPACQGFPPVLLNLQSWPLACEGARNGSVCEGTCNSNYRALPPPRSTCLSNSSWSAPTPGACQLGSGGAWPSPSPVVPSPSPVQPSPSPVVVPSPSPVQPSPFPGIGTAFIANSNPPGLTMCYLLSGGTLDSCVRHTTAAGISLSGSIVNVAVLGDRVWFSSGNGPARIYICTWSGLSLTSCSTSTADGLWNAANMLGNLVIDAANQVAYMADYYTSNVIMCTNIQTMSGCTVQLSPSTPFAVRNPNPLALEGPDLYIGTWAIPRLVRCPVGATGINVAGCAELMTSPYAAWGGLGALEVSGERLYMIGTFAPSTVQLCVSLVCTSYSAGGLPLTTNANTASMAVFGGLLLLPSWGTDPGNSATSGIVVCTDAVTVSGCVMQLAGTGLVRRPLAIVVAPAPP